MTQPIGQSQASIYAAQALKTPSIRQATFQPAVDPFKGGENVNCHSVDISELFTPSESRTIENMKSFARANGMSEKEVSMVAIPFISAKLSDKTTPLSKDVIGNQIRAIQGGYLENSPVKLADYQKLYDNFQFFQGTDILA